MKSIFLKLLTGGLMAWGCLGTAWADLANDVTVRLQAPGGAAGDPAPIDVTEVAPLATGILAANLLPPATPLGDVATFMLDDERISFAGNSIHIRVAAGEEWAGPTFFTGYHGLGPDPAQYLLSNLNITGFTITGFEAYAFDGFLTSGTTGLLAPANVNTAIQLVDAHSLSLNLDSLEFVNRVVPGYKYAEIRIDLLTTPVPEPSAVALGSLAVLGLAALRRRQGRPCKS